LKMFASRAGAELERKRSEEVIKNMAYHDALTGLPNRMLLNDRLKMGLAHAQRNKRIMAVLFIDLDGFKEINDSYGHGIGDLILQGVADRLTQCIREEDTLSRLGGDEFIVFLPRISSVEDAENLAEKLLAVVRTPFYFDGQMMRVSLSIGISFFPKDGKSASVLLKKADEALYQAKNKGKNTYCLVD
jgi:diguanylate cyclase (GGDEF)-like protein